jgi:hypothetical protein
MKTQKGEFLAKEQRDADMLADFGLLGRPQLHTDKELKELLPNLNYAAEQPITFYTEKLKDGTFYMSAADGDTNPFGKNNKFLKTFHQYTHTKC